LPSPGDRTLLLTLGLRPKKKISLPRRRAMKVIVATLLLGIVGSSLSAQVNFSGLYTQNFDALPSTGSTTLLTSAPPAQTGLSYLSGWYAAKLSGNTSSMTLIADPGSSTTAGIHSFGATSATERALGSLASSTATPAFGAAFVNTTGQTISSVNLSFVSEFWRSGAATSAGGVQNSLSFAYGLSGGTATLSNFLFDTSLIAQTALNVVGPPPPMSGNGAQLDGNLLANEANVSGLINLTWAPGQTLYIRWQDFNDAGNNAGLAIDNLVVAIPEPSAIGLVFGLAVVGAALRRRRAPLVLS